MKQSRQTCLAKLDRRRFLGVSCGLIPSAYTNLVAVALGSDQPGAVNPRTIAGDSQHEPEWENRLTVTVGPEKADIIGTTNIAIQAAVDFAARMGKSIVKILPGEYRCRNSIFLPSRIRILGSGQDSVIVKEDMLQTNLIEDSDWYDQEVSLASANSFQLGDGVFLTVRKPGAGGPTKLKRTLVARNGKRFKIDRPLGSNLWLANEPTCSTRFPIFCGENIEDITIERLTLDGNRTNNENLDGNHGGCIWLQRCNRVTMSDLTVRNYNGDGISWQVCHDVVVQRCQSFNNTDFGLHPGSGSQRPVIRENMIERNGIGVYWCWGVKFGLAEKNVIVDSVNHGMTIGHNDTDNIIRNNEILRSGVGGILFRDDKRGRDFWANRNTIESNRIVDSGGDEGIAIDVMGQTKDVLITRNEIIESRRPAQRVGIRLGPKTKDIAVNNNAISGCAVKIQDLST